MPQTLFTVFEDRQKKLTLTSDQEEDILSFRNILGKNRLSLSCDGYLRVSYYVGFISRRKTRLQILPKVYEDTAVNNETEQHESMQVMMNLLKVSEFNNVLGLPDQSSFAEQSDIMEVFIAIFADKVFRAYSRQMNREYISIAENSNFIKGRIDFPANLRKNIIRKDLHIVNFQSFEHDNLINNIIKTMCIKLLRLTVNADNKKNLKRALVFLDDAREIAMSKDLFDAVKFTRLNMPFRPVFEMAKMFFCNLAPQAYQGDDTVCSFLIPLNELFEFYVYKLFDAFGDGTNTLYQNTKVFARSVDSDFRMNIRPDIILEKDKKSVLIADAKYKNPGYENGVYTNINQADIYQVFTYSKVYDVDYAALIYPQFGNTTTLSMVIELNYLNKKVNLTIGCVDIKQANIVFGSEKLKEMWDFSKFQVE
jgi:5-methylcytosine-specific restriction enzyme subunit McrC